MADEPFVPSTSASVVWKDGYAIGPASAIASIAANSDRGIKTGCETPPPSAADKADWKPSTSAHAKERLVDLNDRDLGGEVTQRLLDKIFGAGYAAMSTPEKNAYNVMTLEMEVANGGIQQYFDNSSGNCALQTLGALREMGYVAELATFEKAVSAFPGARPSEDRATRFDQMRTMKRNAWPDEHALYSLTSSPIFAAYIRKHLAEFDLPPN